MAHRMLFVGVDLAEGLASAQRLEHRIIAETLGPARRPDDDAVHPAFEAFDMAIGPGKRSEEHTSELQSLMRISYAVFCLKKKKQKIHQTQFNSQIDKQHHTYQLKLKTIRN